MRAFYCVKTTCQEMLDKLSTGVWKPLGEITQSGGIDIWHTVLNERLHCVVIDYRHVAK